MLLVLGSIMLSSPAIWYCFLCIAQFALCVWVLSMMYCFYCTAFNALPVVLLAQVSGISGVDDSVMAALAASCRDSLTYLDLSFCRYIPTYSQHAKSPLLVYPALHSASQGVGTEREFEVHPA